MSKNSRLPYSWQDFQVILNFIAESNLAFTAQPQQEPGADSGYVESV